MDLEEERSRLLQLRNLLEMRRESESQFSSLLDLSFQVEGGGHFLDDFPIWDQNLAMQQKGERPSLMRVGIFKSGRLLSVGGARLAEIKTITRKSLNPRETLDSPKTLKVAMIGAVATLPEWRGRGLASRVVSHLIAWARRQDTDLIILWTSQERLYQRLGFGNVGEQIRIPLRQVALNTEYPGKVYSGWSPRIFDLLQKRESGIILRNYDRFWLEAHKNVKWFYCGEGDRPVAYAALGRGIDLKGVVHEWGGEKAAVLKIFQTIQKIENSATVLGNRSLFQDLGFSMETAFVEPLCMAKILKESTVRPLLNSIWIWGLDAV